jgi:hypothetical protein
MNRAGAFIVIVAGIIVVLLSAALYMASHQGPVHPPPVPPVEDTLPDAQNENAIIATHRYLGGTHTISGEIDLPTPCHEIETNLIIRKSYPEQVTIEFAISSPNDVICAQVISPHPFTVSFDAAEEALITATRNGEPIILTLIEG